MPIKKRRLSDGSIVYDVRLQVGIKRDGKPDRRSVTVKTKTQAKIEEAKLITIRDRNRNKSNKILLREYVNEFWWPTLTNLAPSSRATYEKELRLRILPYFGDMDIHDITRRDIQQMVNDCKTESPARKAVSLLKTILNEAISDGFLVTNPAIARYAMPAPGATKKDDAVITRFEDMAPLLEAVKAYGDDSIKKIAYLGLLQGLRPEERYGLNHEDINREELTISIERAYTGSSKAEGGNVLKATKTEESTRVLPMMRAFYTRLDEFPEGKGAFILGANKQRISPSTARKRWTRFLKWADENGYDFPHITIENMRHSFATSYLAAGGKVEDLSKILGHTNIQTTLTRYVRKGFSDMRRGMDSMPDI